MVEQSPDWCVSRQRTWGVPITLFINKETQQLHPQTAELIEQVAQRVEKEGIDAWFDLEAADLLGDEADQYGWSKEALKGEAIISQGVSKPVDAQDGYLLYPSDELILGIQNSISENKNSSWKNLDDGTEGYIHYNSMTIPEQTGTLRLFGRYKRKDKFETPSSNLSLYHNSEANEPIGSEDVRDQYELEQRQSYAGSMRDEIVSRFANGNQSFYSFSYEPPSDVSTNVLSLNPEL